MKPKYMIKLQEVILEARKEIISPEAQSNVSDSEILGILVSKHSEWDLGAIADVTDAALEDSNFKPKDLVELYQEEGNN